MTEQQHANTVKAMKAKITRTRNKAKKIPLLADKIEAHRLIKKMEAELLEFKLNFYALTAN